MNREKLINAIASGDVKGLKGLRKYTNPGILIDAPDDDGKYFTIPGRGEERREISLAEIEKLSEERPVIVLTRAEGGTEVDISHSEEEVIKKMKNAGEWRE